MGALQVRTVSNSMETVVVTIVLLYWPWDTAGVTSSHHRRKRYAILLRETISNDLTLDKADCVDGGCACFHYSTY